MGTASVKIQARFKTKNSNMTTKSRPLFNILPNSENIRFNINSKMITEKPKMKGPIC